MTTRLKPPAGPGDHVEGLSGAPVTLTEFGDFECPFCRQAHFVVEALQETLGDRLRFVFRNFPLAQVHPHALIAAEAAEAAGAQRRYWEMHDLLYEHEDALEPPDLVQYATLIGLDLERFGADIAAHRHRDKVRADLHSGALSGVNGTPTFFINGVRHDGGWDFDSLWDAIAGATGAELIA
jgi:protein-disulfide isomerase